MAQLHFKLYIFKKNTYSRKHSGHAAVAALKSSVTVFQKLGWVPCSLQKLLDNIGPWSQLVEIAVVSSMWQRAQISAHSCFCMLHVLCGIFCEFNFLICKIFLQRGGWRSTSVFCHSRLNSLKTFLRDLVHVWVHWSNCVTVAADLSCLSPWCKSPVLPHPKVLCWIQIWWSWWFEVCALSCWKKPS